MVASERQALSEPRVELSEFARRRWPMPAGCSAEAAPVLITLAGVLGLLVIFLSLGGNLAFVAVGLAIMVLPLVWWLLSWLAIAPQRRVVVAQNELDYRTARAIRDAAHSLFEKIPPTNDLVPGAVVRRDMAIGELTRHFDGQTIGSITGWLQHSLRGWGSFVATAHQVQGLLGPNSAQTGTTGLYAGVLTGVSQVNLNLNAITRDDLFTEGFVAVFEEHGREGIVDTLRLIIPAEPACRAFVVEACEAIGTCYGEGSFRHHELREIGANLRGAFKTDISYVSDRLNAVLRMEPGDRLTIAVVGSEVSEHALLGGAVEFSDRPGQWYQLFPLGLLQRLREIVTANDTPKEELPPL